MAALDLLGYAVQVLCVFLASTVVFDVVHFLLHACSRSSWAPLRAVGALHLTHHRFLDRTLVIRPEFERANLLRHVIPEYLTQVSVSLVLFLVLPGPVVWGAIAIQTVVFLLILRARGRDVNHRTIAKLAAYRPMFFCLPRYHALHHVYPDAHYSSWIKLLDHLLGSGACLAGKRVSLAEADVELTGALRARGAEIVPGDSTADEADVLILRNSDPDPLSHAIEEFCRGSADRKLPGEVWAIGPPSRAWRRIGRRYYTDPRVIFRYMEARDADAPRTGREAAALVDRVARGFHFASTGGVSATLLGFARFRLTRA